MPNLDKIFKSMDEILLLPVSEKPSPYWNCTSDFYFDDSFAIGMWFSVCLPNFIRIRQSATDMTSYRSSKMAATGSQM